MNELKKQTWAKVAALVLAIISGFMLVVTGTAAVIFGMVPETQLNQSEMEAAIQKQILRGYGNYLLQDSRILDEQNKSEDAISKIDWSGLDGGNIRYSVIRQQADGSSEQVLYTNDASVDTDSAQAVVNISSEGATVQVMQQLTMWSLMYGYANQSWYYGGANDWRSRHVEQVVYNREDGIFYV